MYISFKVTMQGIVAGQPTITLEDRMDDPQECNNIDVFVRNLKKQWGDNCDIQLHIWRDNWQA